MNTSEYRQFSRGVFRTLSKTEDELFALFALVNNISGKSIKFPREIIKTSVAIEMYKTENQCKTSQVLGATGGTRHTGKRGLRNLERTQGSRTERRTLSLRTHKTILSLKTLKRTLSQRTLKITLSRSTLKRTLKRTLPITEKPEVGPINEDPKEDQERNENEMKNFQTLNLPLL